MIPIRCCGDQGYQKRESDENWKEISNQMPYSVRLVSNPMKSGRMVSLLSLKSSLPQRADEKLKPIVNANAIPDQIGQQANGLWYKGQLVLNEV